MIILSPVKPEDILDIEQWPRYEGVHAQMDYALRKDGWLASYCSEPGNFCYAAKIGSLCIGFSLLIPKENRKAEFRIAVHPAHIGAGHGGEILRKTLLIGFAKHSFETIYLIVRKNNQIAQRLYSRHGFILYGEKQEIIQGQSIDFFMMQIDSATFMRGEI